MSPWVHSVRWVDCDPECSNWMGDPPLHIMRAIVRAYPLAWVTA